MCEALPPTLEQNTMNRGGYCPSVCLSVCLSVRLSVCPSVCLSVHLVCSVCRSCLCHVASRQVWVQPF